MVFAPLLHKTARHWVLKLCKNIIFYGVHKLTTFIEITGSVYN
jgi:hypothetical protein